MLSLHRLSFPYAATGENTHPTAAYKAIPCCASCPTAGRSQPRRRRQSKGISNLIRNSSREGSVISADSWALSAVLLAKK